MKSLNMKDHEAHKEEFSYPPPVEEPFPFVVFVCFSFVPNPCLNSTNSSRKGLR